MFHDVCVCRHFTTDISLALASCPESQNQTITITQKLTLTLPPILTLTQTLDSEDGYCSGSQNISHNNSLSKDYLHSNDHAKQITDTPGLKPFTMQLTLTPIPIQTKPLGGTPIYISYTGMCRTLGYGFRAVLV